MLNVKLYSFGYKKSGIPADDTPNNGGFVFDCRYIKNPRWDTELENLNGKDQPVIDFLDSEEQMQEFMNNVKSIITEVIENYISRDFTNLMISFGCTGGQHRSVYAAEELNKFLKNTFREKINVNLTHIEFPELSI